MNNIDRPKSLLARLSVEAQLRHLLRMARLSRLAWGRKGPPKKS